MAKSKRSAPTRGPTSPPASSRKRRRSEPQSPETHKSSTPIHYEIDTEYGRLTCDYDVSTALATDEQGDEVAAIVKLSGIGSIKTLPRSQSGLSMLHGSKRMPKRVTLPTYRQSRS
jgi:hypothetical protein